MHILRIRPTALLLPTWLLLLPREDRSHHHRRPNIPRRGVIRGNSHKVLPSHHKVVAVVGVELRQPTCNSWPRWRLGRHRRGTHTHTHTHHTRTHHRVVAVVAGWWDHLRRRSRRTILGHRNWPARIPVASSNLYSRNLLTFLTTFWDKEAKAPALPADDDIVKGVMLTRGGAVVHPNFLPKQAA